MLVKVLTKQALSFIIIKEFCAGIAQLAEQLICNQQVVGSIPIASSSEFFAVRCLSDAFLFSCKKITANSQRISSYLLYGLFFFGNFTFEVMVGHCANAGVGPNVFCGFNHIDDGVNRQDDTHDADRSADAAHQRQGEEVAAHRYACVTNSSQYGYQQPCQHGGHGQLEACVLHYENGGNQDEGSAAVHVDGGADRQYKAGNSFVNLQVLFSGSHGYRQGACGALGEQSNSDCRRHFLEYINRVQPLASRKIGRTMKN